MNRLAIKITKYGQKRLADDANLTESMVSQVVHGGKSFGKKTAPKVARLLDVPLSVALGIDK